MSYRRKSMRMDIDRVALIGTPDGEGLRSCRLRDMSARGAKLLLDDHGDLPERVVLHLKDEGTAWPCRIVRRQAGVIGVQFV
jgi:hypothetical protein